jgi:toxin secretion/phage lysis holin
MQELELLKVRDDGVTISTAAILKWVLAFLAGQLLQVSALVWYLIGFMFIDYVTGIISAYIRRELSSEQGLRGLCKKCAQLFFLLAAHWAEQVAGLGLQVSGVSIHIEGGIALLFIFNEAISIAENVAGSGADLPEWLVIWMLRLKKVRMRAASANQLRQLRERDSEDRR